MGKHDYKPRYECLDENTNKPVPFDLGADWKPFTLSPLCMKHRVTGMIKNDCVKYESEQDRDVKYLYLNKDSGKYAELVEQWQPLPLDDPLCEPLKFGADDPIKHFEFELLSDPEEAAQEEEQE